MKKTLSHFCSSLIFFALSSHFAHALPQDSQVVSGSAKIEKINPHLMEIRPSDQAIIHYSKFNIGKEEDDFEVPVNILKGQYKEIITNEEGTFSGSDKASSKILIKIPAQSVRIYKLYKLQ